MKTAWMMVCGLAGLLAVEASAEALKLGDTAPMADVKMKNVDGKTVSIDNIKGKKGTLVIFSCNHCPFVKAWETRTAALGNAALKEGIGVIQINANDPTVAGDSFEGMQARAKERGFEFPYVVDDGSRLAKAFGASRTPEAFLFNGDGKLVYHGTIDDNYQNADAAKEHYLKDALDAVVNGKDIAVKETKAVGCSIKFYKKS